MSSKTRQTRRKTQQLADKGTPSRPRNAAQSQAADLIDKFDIVFLLGPAGGGKAQPLTSTVYGPDGPRKMGELVVGDYVANASGGFSKVLAIYPQGEKQILRVHFADGTHVDACEDHLWQVRHHDTGKMDIIVTTKTIEENCKGEGNRRPFSIMCPEPVAFSEKNYYIQPYTMGILLAEGGLTGSNVCFSSCETEVVERVRSELPHGMLIASRTRKKVPTQAGSVDHRITRDKGDPNCENVNPVKKELERLNLWGKYAYEKHIPEEYLYGSVNQRIALLQGMMDGDGFVASNGRMSYNSTSKTLVEDFSKLVMSLGGSTKISAKQGAKRPDGTRHRTSYNCYFRVSETVQVASLKRKMDRFQPTKRYNRSRQIDRVERLGFVPMQCISIDHPTHLYLTDNYTVTHNTHAAVSMTWERICRGQCDRVIVTRPMVACGGEDIGYLPGDKNEKLHPWLMPIEDVLINVLGDRKNAESVMKTFEALPMAHVRGRNFLAGTVAVCDEAQNCTVPQLHAYLTRVCTGGKVIVCGDPDQGDLYGGGGHLVEVARELEAEGVAAVVDFSGSMNMRNPKIDGINKAFARVRKRIAEGRPQGGKQ